MLAAYARLAVRVGVNLQPGQRLAVNALLEHAPLVRAVAAEAYEAGASYVDVLYVDQHVRRAHIEGVARRVARLVAALDRAAPRRARRRRRRRSSGSPGTRSRSSSPTSTAAGSRRSRMREADRGLAPAHGRADQLVDRRVPERGLGADGVRRARRRPALAGGRDRRPPRRARSRRGLEGPPRGARRPRARAQRPPVRRPPLPRPRHGPHGRPPPRRDWLSAIDVSSSGIECVANMPTEEVFTTPDARRVDGTVTRHLPAAAPGQRDPEPPRSASRAAGRSRSTPTRARTSSARTSPRATTAPPASARSRSSTAPRGSARPASSSTTPSSTRTRPRTSRSARRSRRRSPRRRPLRPAERHEQGINHSSLHTDFMIGSPEVDVWGVTADGAETPILAGGDWVL